MAEGDGGLDSGVPWWGNYSGDPRLREQVEAAQRSYMALPLTKRVEHDMAQQRSWIRGGGFEPGHNMRVTLLARDVEELLRLAKQATGEE